MKVTGLMFKGEMIRGLLREIRAPGTGKTQTRRVLKPLARDGHFYVEHGCNGLWPWRSHDGKDMIALDGGNPVVEPLLCPYGAPGDLIWARETWREDSPDDPERAIYKADELTGLPAGFKWKSSMFMPRWASRITLAVTGVRVERLQDIIEKDAVAEGCEAKPFPGPWWQGYRDFGDGELIHQQSVGESPPDWMIEPKRMKDAKRLDRAGVDIYRVLWDQINGVDSWDANPWVWVVVFRPHLTNIDIYLERHRVQ